MPHSMLQSRAMSLRATLLRITLALVAVVLLAAIGAVAAVVVTAETPPHRVGFAQFAIADPPERPLDIGVWYPTDAEPGLRLAGLSAQRVASDGAVKGDKLPLVIISHGNGALLSSHSDTALALASAGFVAAAVSHTGDNARDDRYAGQPRELLERPRQVHRALDYLLREWPAHTQLDAARVGMFGFSAGAFTGLVVAGGVPDLARIASHCREQPEFICTLWMELPAASPPPSAWVHDPRVKALVAAAPGYGFAFEPTGLAAVTVPVQLWLGAADRRVPYETNLAVIRRLLPNAPEYRQVPDAGHFAFLAPCPAWLFPAFCKDADGFDRKAFHREFNARVVAFFRTHLAGT
jgi:predicted dienelactone hydrolase